MKVVITRSFGSYKRGMRFDWAPSFANILIRRGLVESLESLPELEAAVGPEVEVERAVAVNKPKRRRKQ